MADELLSLKWNNHKSIFTQVISDQRSKASYSDVTLACNGRFYPAHKLIISACSEYFKSVLDQTSHSYPIIILKDIENNDLEYLLDYMYIGEVNVKQNELVSLVGAAECLKIKGLAIPDCSLESEAKEELSKSHPPRKRLKRKHNSFNNNEDQCSNKGIEDTVIKPNMLNVSVTNPTEVESSMKELPLTIKEEIHADELILKEELLVDDSAPCDLEIQGNVFCTSEPDLDIDFSNPLEASSSTKKDNWSNYEVSLPVELSILSPSEELTNNDLNEFHSSPNEIYFDEENISDHSQDSSLLNCHLCQFSTTFEAELKQHMSLHKGEKRFKCTYCEYKTLNKSHLSRHYRKHTGERPYSCHFCGYKSSDSTTLKRHIHIHLKKREHII